MTLFMSSHFILQAGKHNGSDDALGSKAKVIADSSAAAKCKADEPKSKSKKSKEAPAASPRQSPRLAASGSGGVVPAVDIGKKRKLDAAAEEPAAAGGGSKSGSRAGACAGDGARIYFERAVYCGMPRFNYSTSSFISDICCRHAVQACGRERVGGIAVPRH